ncbi:STAS-like domain-containing protein [Lamprobacter modestohalophilus]|uniref:STAS-like domain-containing protein n=1 Tax=Lamprobacter modestohalophilus TaxID=1064514 RepID=UPI002ADEE5AB|nr:STAS-like domain-containing protein [Lamprobacter modestohalophilus]
MTTATVRQLVPLQNAAKGRFFGMRQAAVPDRERIEGFLAQGAEVAIDFAGAAVTQSFVDELVGRLILEQGPDVLQRIIFKNCSDDTRAVIRFVAADRVDQYLKAKTH